MERRMSQDPSEDSPLATLRDVLPSAYILSDGPVRYLLVAGERDDGLWGSIGAYWQSHVGVAGKLMIDPQQHADALFQVARRVGAI